MIGIIANLNIFFGCNVARVGLFIYPKLRCIIFVHLNFEEHQLSTINGFDGIRMLNEIIAVACKRIYFSFCPSREDPIGLTSVNEIQLLQPYRMPTFRLSVYKMLARRNNVQKLPHSASFGIVNKRNFCILGIKLLFLVWANRKF